MPEGLKTRSIKGLLWSMSESAGVAVLSLGAFIFIARLLEPADIGAVAMASAFIIIFNLVVAHSFADAVVLRTDLTRVHLDTAFWSTLGSALLLIAGCYFAADLVAQLVGEPKVATILPWMSIVLFCNALGIVPIAMFRRDLRFRTLAMCNLSGRLVGALSGIVMAIAGYGMWSLVALQVVAAVVTNIAVILAMSWRPRLHFSLPYLRQLGGFGFHVSASQVVSGIGEQALNLVLGTLFGSAVLGHFSVAWRMVQLIRALIATAVYQVAFSAFAKLQHDRALMRQAFLQATRMSCLVGFPLSLGMALVAEPAILTLFGAKWQDSVLLFSILALEMLPIFFVMFFTAVYRTMHRPSWALGTAILYFSVGITGMHFLAPYGIVAVTAFWVFKSFLLTPAHIFLMRRLLGISVGALTLTAAAPLGAAGVMAGAVALVLWGLQDQLPVLQLAAAIVTGVASYAAAAFLMAPDLVKELLNAGRIMANRAPKPAPPANDADLATPARPSKVGAARQMS